MISSFDTFNKANRFKDLIESVQFCDLCPRLCDSRKVMSVANGNIDSRVLFIAEAPGRLGADRTGVPLFGDRTGDNFEILLGNVGWRREEIFITNAVLCNPKRENGNNGTPTTEEIANCSAYLEMTLSLVDPAVIVTLGAMALHALDLLSSHGVELRHGVAQIIPWRNTRLFPLYHPGPRALIHRSLSKQRSDFMLLSKAVHPIKGLAVRRRPRREAPRLFPAGASAMQQVARVLIELGGKMTYFKLSKLMYLVDLLSIERFGHTIASSIYLRQQEGPWSPDLDKELQSMHGHEILRFFTRNVPMVALGPAPRFDVRLDDDILDVISNVIRMYGSMSNAQIKTAVYCTAPMKFVLQQEKRGKKLLNKPVIYKNKTAQELAASER
jgi:uracil-DNA glycosylase family 4